MKTLHLPANERGFVLLAVYMVVIFISLFSVVFFARHQFAIQTTERYQNRTLAFNAAEAGIDYALRELATSATRRSTTATTTYTSSTSSLGQHTFQYTIAPVSGKSMMRRIDSTGCAPTCTTTSRAHQSTAITVYSEITTPAPPAGLFEYGIYTTTAINLSGAAFDSYNSSQGAYGGSNINTTGAIAANTTVISGVTWSKMVGPR